MWKMSDSEDEVPQVKVTRRPAMILELPKVVRIRMSRGVEIVSCDIYIGYPVRASGWNLNHGKWSSPFALSAFGKERCQLSDIQMLNTIYECYVRASPELMGTLHELSGKRLGCFCPPLPCHGEILVKLFREVLLRP